jgi:transcriptional regulator with XRE-family HTH domain
VIPREGASDRQTTTLRYHGPISPLRSDLEAIATIARAVFELRTALGWSQAELARRAGVSQSLVSAVETGRFGSLTFQTAVRLLEAMGARLTVAVDRPYLGERGMQRDAAHARCVGHVERRLAAAGWKVAREVEVGGNRSRGWIDVLAFHPSTGLVLVIEVKTELHDLGQIERTLGWYEREAWAAARRRGWRPGAVVGALLLLATDANEGRLHSNRELLAVAFPVRATTLASSVTSGLRQGPGRALALIDPRSKRRRWLRPSRLDGRKSPSPYLDYAGFMRATTRSTRVLVSS